MIIALHDSFTLVVVQQVTAVNPVVVFAGFLCLFWKAWWWSMVLAPVVVVTLLFLS